MSREDLGLDAAALNRSWARAMEILREQGKDPNQVLADAADAVQRWQSMTAAERQVAIEEATAEWAAWEEAVDDAGNPR